MASYHHSDFSENATFYVHYNDRDNTSIISQFKLSDDDNLADKASEAVLLTMRQPFANHNGGEIAFGPDGYLYVGVGDGGWEGDVINAGQDLHTLLGKMLQKFLATMSVLGTPKVSSAILFQ